MTEVLGRFINNYPEEAGEFKYVRRADKKALYGIHFVCPCGCKTRVVIPFKSAECEGPMWNWNGNKEKPTVTPSIRRLDGCMWHGFLTKGVFIGKCEKQEV